MTHMNLSTEVIEPVDSFDTMAVMTDAHIMIDALIIRETELSYLKSLDITRRALVLLGHSSRASLRTARSMLNQALILALRHDRYHQLAAVVDVLKAGISHMLQFADFSREPPVYRASMCSEQRTFLCDLLVGVESIRCIQIITDGPSPEQATYFYQQLYSLNKAINYRVKQRRRRHRSIEHARLTGS